MSLEGHQLGRYRLQHLLGSGGMGEVYLATDASLNRQVAIKVIRAEAESYPEAQADKEAARLFQRELRTIAALDHPHILPLFDSGEESAGRTTLTYMVMPYRHEGSLADWLHQRERGALLSPREVEHVVQQAASALQHAHSQQIIHQDVKPSNFLIRSREKQPERPDVLLADFGVAKFISATAGMSQASRGTPTYMAPEQWEGHPVPATDQYALAVMAYELLTRRPPFQGGMAQLMYQHFHVQPQPPSTFYPRLSQALDAVLLRALAKDPKERFPSVSAFAEAFEQAAQSSEAPTVAKLPPAPSRDMHATLAISAQEALTGTSRSLTLPGGRRVTVTIPAGAQDGQMLRLEGQGEAAEDGVAGALVLTLAIATTVTMAPRSDAQQAEAQTFLLDTPPVPPIGITTGARQETAPIDESRITVNKHDRENANIWSIGRRRGIAMVLSFLVTGLFVYIVDTAVKNFAVLSQPYDFSLFLYFATANIFFCLIRLFPLFFGVTYGPWVGMCAALGHGFLGDYLSGRFSWLWTLGLALAGIIAGLALLKTRGKYDNTSSIATAVVIAAIGASIGLAIPLYGRIWLIGESVLEASRIYLTETLPTIFLIFLLLPLLLTLYNRIVERGRSL